MSLWLRLPGRSREPEHTVEDGVVGLFGYPSVRFFVIEFLILKLAVKTPKHRPRFTKRGFYRPTLGDVQIASLYTHTPNSKMLGDARVHSHNQRLPNPVQAADNTR